MAQKSRTSRFLEFVRYYLNFNERRKNNYLIQMKRLKKMKYEDLEYYQTKLKSAYIFKKFLLKGLKWLIGIWIAIPILLFVKFAFGLRGIMPKIENLSLMDRQVALVTLIVAFLVILAFLVVACVTLKRYIIHLEQKVSKVDSIVQQKISQNVVGLRK
ncbi:hypothetical protein ABC639_08800 [Lacticaseibacillus paracasei]|jgi:uncharacterized membrane protein|uniref:hypothetical protein n=1 Tax=Lactobacillaceae TaxID=33958 RepID=UPI0005174D85|nr:hypothetical protein [Lacticaseibacillus paracasei]MDE3278784.1 hypothetical protein [Lacticaseibacillus paracasei]